MTIYIYNNETEELVGTIERDLAGVSDQAHQDGQNEMLAEAEAEFGSNEYNWNFSGE